MGLGNGLWAAMLALFTTYVFLLMEWRNKEYQPTTMKEKKEKQEL